MLLYFTVLVSTWYNLDQFLQMQKHVSLWVFSFNFKSIAWIYIIELTPLQITDMNSITWQYLKMWFISQTSLLAANITMQYVFPHCYPDCIWRLYFYPFMFQRVVVWKSHKRGSPSLSNNYHSSLHIHVITSCIFLWYCISTKEQKHRLTRDLYFFSRSLSTTVLL